MGYELRIDGRPLDAEATAPDAEGRCEVTLAGETGPLEARSVRPHHLRLLWQGRARECFVVRTREGTWVWSEGRARLVEEGPPRRAAARERGGAQAVTPPTPAMVARVCVAPGQTVARGEVVVVVTAMKMETALVAPHAGTVRAVHAEEGARVAPGDRLVEIEPVEATADE